MERRKHRRLLPAKQFIRQCRVAWRRTKVADSAGTKLTGGRLLAGSLALHKLLTSTVLKPENNSVALLLPPSVGGVLANAAVTLAGKVAVNLNYTLSEDVVNYCIKEAGVQQILTSRRFMEKRPMNLSAELIYLEDLSQQISGLAKINALLTAWFVPLRMLSRQLGLERVKPDDVMSIIFTSGSTGDPKGVMLTNDNVASNIEAVRHLLHLRATDSVLGVLPFFHSFGYTVSMWLPLCTEPSGVYHFNPLDASTVGKLIEKHKSTILLATPTFLRSYMKRCTVEQMNSLNMVIVGAEKMPDELRDSFREKYGFEPSEGYGTTELSPIAAVNIPVSRLGAEYSGQSSSKHGTVGRVIPGSVAAVFDLDTNERLGTNKEGMLKIKGPNVMLGYLNHPRKTEELIQDGWYTTGDLGMIDEEGFIRVTGRLSRFSKIGGEMVPHIRIEQEIARIIDDTPENETRTGQTLNGQTPDEDASGDAEIMCAVTAVPDSSKGERLVVLHKPMQKSAREIIDQLQLAGLPNLWIPSSNCFLEVSHIPLLGTGKLDLRAVKEMAITLCEAR
jgi:acyl-[acyl-carrier-protein]-phospholipid O-acyltransferase/long-chain-fatty-acid--[acyl-carrier-protein] ligase